MVPRSRGWGYSRVCEDGIAWTGCCSSVCRESEGVGIGALLQKERGLIAGVLANEVWYPGTLSRLTQAQTVKLCVVETTSAGMSA